MNFLYCFNVGTEFMKEVHKQLDHDGTYTDKQFLKVFSKNFMTIIFEHSELDISVRYDEARKLFFEDQSLLLNQVNELPDNLRSIKPYQL